MRHALVASALLSVAAAGCVPSRDNPFDPSRSPDVRARILLMERVENVDCADSPGEIVGAVLSASRGDCLLLDASETTDPQGHSFTLTYFVATSNGTPVQTLAEDTTETTILIPRSALGTVRTALTQSVPAAYFGVRATDSTGARGTGLITLAIENHAPVVSRAAPYLVPEGGLPWARGPMTPVTLDAHGTFDPDRDTMRFCWRRATSDPEACDLVSGDDGFEFSGGESWTVDVPTEPGRHLFHLTVEDGDFAGPTRVHEVRVGSPPVWGYAEGLRRFDESSRTWTKPVPGTMRLARGAGGEEWVLLHDAIDTIHVIPWPALGAPVATIDAGTQLVKRIAAGPLAAGGTRVWIATAAPAGGTDVAIHDLSANGLTVTPVRTVHVALEDPRVLFPDATGAAAAIGGADALEIVPAITPLTPWTVPIAAGATIEGGGARPGSTQMWFSASSVGRDLIYALDFDPVNGPTNVGEQIAPHAWREWTWFDEGHFWVASADYGLVLSEPDHYTELARIEDVLDIAGDLHVDPGTGACHATTATALVTAHTDGRSERVPKTAALAAVGFVSAGGELAIDSAGDDVRVARTLHPEGIEAAADVELAGAHRTSTGGVWGIASGPAIAHVTTDGSTDRFITVLDVFDVGGVELAAPLIAMDPDEQGGWLLESGVLYRLYEIWVDPYFPEYEEAFVVTDTPPAGYVPIASTSPVADPRFVWLWSSGENAYKTITSAGTLADAVALGAEGGTVAAPSYGLDELCVFSQLDATTLRHRRAGRTGVAAGPIAVQVTSGTMALRSPFAIDATGGCGVVAGTSASHVLVFDADGALVHRYTSADAIESVTATGDGEYWMTGDDGTGARFLARVVVDSAGNAVTEPWPYDVPADLVLLP